MSPPVAATHPPWPSPLRTLNNTTERAAPPHTAAPAERGPTLAVQMLDGFHIWVGAEPLRDLPHGKARTLLKLLLLQRRRPLSRARLCTLMWPDAETEAARNNLHVTLHRLRRTLGTAGQVQLLEEGYQLQAPGEVSLDTEQFVLHAEMGQREEEAGRHANAIGQYLAAIALYHSDLLDEEETEAALAAPAQGLRDRLAEVLERLAVLQEQQGHWHACLRTTLHQLGQDECNETAHRRLMRCYARLGQVGQAERQYRACVKRLRQHLGLAPSAETTALYRSITSGVPA